MGDRPAVCAPSTDPAYDPYFDVKTLLAAYYDWSPMAERVVAEAAARLGDWLARREARNE